MGETVRWHPSRANRLPRTLKPCPTTPEAAPPFPHQPLRTPRYLFVHEERGLLVVSKKPDSSKPYWHKDHTNFPLADCSSITADNSSKEPHCFALTCNHERLLLRTDSAAERNRWVAGLLSLQRQAAGADSPD